MKLKDGLLLGRKTMTSLDSILKSRDITLLTKVYPVKAMVFSVVMYRCESWMIKKAEHQRTNAFELWCCRRLSRVPWRARRSNQSILKEINSKYSLEGLMLKLQYYGHLMQRADSLEKTPMLGKTEHRRGQQRMRWLDDITDSMDDQTANASGKDEPIHFFLLKEISPTYPLEGLMLKLKFWPPDEKNWLIWKDPDAGKDWRQEEKGMTENKMVGWHHRLNGHEFE